MCRRLRMAKLYEYQGKELLAKGGISVPRGGRAASKEEARKIAEDIGKPVVIKAQAWVTGRAQAGGVKFAQNPEEAEKRAEEILGMNLKGFKVKEVLVEERLEIEREFYVGMIIDDVAKNPVLIFSSVGGTGIEEIAIKYPEKLIKSPVDIVEGIKGFHAKNMLRKLDIRGQLQTGLSDLLVRFFQVCRRVEARSAEINPLVLTKQGQLYAADSHMVIDDYAVFRHPELGIEIAREFDRPPTELEKVAYQIEAKDHRGTFYFLQMEQKFEPRSGYIGFHGAGGGGSMMSMDALLSQGFKLANYCDTSGNPSASKVYRAARIILSQKNIDGYFASGSGVASQEQFHSARGLVKAFREVNLSIPAIIRIGGNTEELAIEILQDYTKDLPGKVEAYGRDTPASFCAKRLKDWVKQWDYSPKAVAKGVPQRPGSPPYHFETVTGTLFIDHEKCKTCVAKPCVDSCTAHILKFAAEGHPILHVSPQEAKKGKCTECLACELACEFRGNRAINIHLPIPGLDKATEA
jgi:succinyl-CoA synthetase beta subunit